MAKNKITIQDTQVRIINVDGHDFICITDMAKKFNERTDVVIQRWLRNRNTVEFLAIWEQLRNPDFNPTQLDGIRQDLGLNSYILSTKKWIEMTNAKGIYSKAGRYGGTYAHKDIAFEFGTWLSPQFKMFMIEEYQRLKQDEAKRLGNPWSIRREIAKANYAILSDSIKDKLIPAKIAGSRKEGLYFASEADMLNQIVFGKTAKQHKSENPNKKGNLRDSANVLQLLVLANLEALNSRLIKWDCDQEQRFTLLKEARVDFEKVLKKNNSVKVLDKNAKKGLIG